MDQNILVVPAEHVNIGFVDGFYSSIHNGEILKEILAQSKFHPRNKAETDESIKQLIPYCVLQFENKFFIYERNSKGGEKRLHAKFSLGIGGHLEEIDGQTPDQVYWNGMLREIKEEVGLDKHEFIGYDIGFIYDNKDAVGRVHLGVLHLLRLQCDVRKIEATMSNYAWESLASLNKHVESFEGWSQIIIKNNLLNLT